MITINDLPQLIELSSYGFVVGIGIGAMAFILASLINSFFQIANKG